MYEIPTQIKVNDKTYAIRNRGDFRMVLDCFNCLADEELTKEERLVGCLIIFYEDLNSIDDVLKIDVESAVEEMYKFFNCGQLESSTPVQNYKLIDWEQDSQMICSAINKVAGKEIRFEPYLHWWTFMGYYSSVGESMLSTVVSIRYKMARGKKLEKYETEFKRENPQYFVWNSKTVEQKEADALVKELWNSGKEVT